MARHLYPLAMALALAACAPGAAEYTKSEAPNQLQVEGSTRAVTVAFAPGSARLGPAAAAHLDGLVATGAIRPADRVTITAAGPPGLAAAREAAISSRLLRWGIAAEVGSPGAASANRALITVGRYAVTLPPCPNWSQPRSNDFTNMPPSNFGCATAVNLGLMVASPADLVAPGELASADGKPAAAAVDRYLNDQVQLPTVAAIGPISISSSSGTPSGSGTPTTATGP
jgi:pilus assembly protein CpaD